MKFRLKRINLFIITMIFLMFTLFINLGYSANQLSFILDPDNPVFTFEETRFNDDTTYKLLEYTQNENHTVYISISKNSTIWYSNITLMGESTPTETITTDEVYSIAVDDAITSTSENEIAVGVSEAVHLLNSSGDSLWPSPFSIEGYNFFGIDIGNVTADEGNEIAAACENKNLYLLKASDGSVLLTYSGPDKFYDVAISNVITSTTENEIAVAGGDGNVTLLNNNFELIWNYTIADSFMGVAIGDVNSTIEGNEVVAGSTDHKVYLFNSTGQRIPPGNDLGAPILDVAIGNVTVDEFNEIAVGSEDKKVYLLDADLEVLWWFETNSFVESVAIGNVAGDDGDEVVVGSRDKQVYVLNSTGDLILSYSTSGWVQAVAVGNLTADPGNEVVAGSKDTRIYILNFEYYPTNVYLDIGEDGDKDWEYLSKIRDPVSIPSSSINTAINEYLNSNGCTSKVCNVPLVFHSDSGGDLNVTSINITYDYDASEAISSTGPIPIDAWSRTNNIEVNETVGNQSINISYDVNPANDIEIRYVKIDTSTQPCDFAGKQYSTTFENGQDVCDLSTDVLIVNKIGNLPPPSLLWDKTMTENMPIWGKEYDFETTPTGEWFKNYTIWNETSIIPAIFYNVTANISIGEEVKSNEGLFVEWENNVYDITPSTDCPDYELNKDPGDDFYVCKGPDSDGNSVADFFILKQPHTSIIDYTVNGSINSLPVLDGFWISPPSDIWGNNFTFSVNVYDHEENNATVNLWIHHIDTDVWEKVDSKNTTGNTSETATLIFEIPSDKPWIGNNWYKYEYADFDGTTNKYIHSFENITPPYVDGFDVLKHNTSILLIEGNDTTVTRTGSDFTNFSVVVTDIHKNLNVTDVVNCSFWITTNGIDFKLANSTTTTSGFCNFTFDPDESYAAGLQWWKAGVYQDAYYYDNTSTNFTVQVSGGLGINLTIMGKNFTRGEGSTLEAKLVDENINDVAEPGYTCTWYINTTQVGISTTDDAGHCNYTWYTDCISYSDLGSYLINVTLSNGASSYYTITNNESSTYVTLKGTLNVTIIRPVKDSFVYERQDVHLNSTVTDECLTHDSYSHNVTWYSLYPSYHPDLCPQGEGGTVSDGMNTTWAPLDWTCTPRYPQIIIANATGELYNSDKKNVSIYIFGFADVEVTTPDDGDVVWRNQSYGRDIGEVKVICKVTSNASSWGQNNYPVNFWKRYMIGSFNNLGSVNTDINGEAIYWWNISMTDDYNYTIKCNISDEPSLYFNASVAEDNINVTPRGAYDATPPAFIWFSANSVEQYKENVTIEAEVYDAWGVAEVNVIIIYPDGTNSTYPMEYYISSNTWKYSYNFTDLGDYDFTIEAKDRNNITNSVSSWFEVYTETVLFYGNTTDAFDNNVSAEFIFYRNGTSSVIYTNKTTLSDVKYNFTIRKRMYDIEVHAFNQTIKFLGINIGNDTENAVYNFDFIPQEDLPLMYGPRNKFIGFAFETILNSSYVNLILNYTGNDEFNPDRFDRGNIHIFKCSNWNYSSGDCDDGDASWVSLGGTPSFSERIVSVLFTGSSCFVAGDEVDPNDGVCDDWAERCKSGQPWHDEICCSGPPTPPSPGGGSSGGGGGPSGPTAVCGNGKCEAGENSQNCPKDCGLPETLFSVRTNMTEPQLNPGTEEIFALWIKNNVNYPVNASFSVTGSIAEFISFDKDSIKIDANKEEINKIYVTIPSNADTGTYTGHITIIGGGKTVTLPISLTVSIKGATFLDVLVDSMNERVGINETARFRVMLYNYGLWKRLDLNLAYYIKDPETQEVFYEENEQLEITQSKTLDKRILLSGLDMSVGRYLFNVTVKYDSKVVSAYDDFEVTKSFWTTDRINQAIIVILIVSIPLIAYFVRKRYIFWKLSKARYIFPLDFRKLPKGRIWLGKIAETYKKAYFKMSELRTHVLTAGATGSGKSVSAMIFVEELLRENVPVIVFDPTAQWSGFVRPCKDPNLLKFYKEFGMDKRDVKPYRGMIYEVTDPNVKIDFDKYMNPGEITVFMLNKLKPGQYDTAVRNIIDTIFAHGWEESTKLRMVVVFDEVHRLLEKYGGTGGYVSLEKACREFRKWGIGLIMASQVLSDFKEAIKGNVLTEIQLHTKSLGDLGRVEKKYGLDYTKRVTRLEVGVGMMQNPRYNKGRPWFTAFRPTLHEPHKIPDRDLELYKEYAAILAKIEAKIESMEKAGRDVFDLKTEFKLAQDKLKKGRFRMAKIYIDSLKKHVLEG